MKQRLIVLGIAFSVTAMLSGCSSAIKDVDESTSLESDLTLAFYSVSLPDGKAVDCVASTYTGSRIIPDCDWANVYVSSSPKSDDSDDLKSYTVTSDDGQTVLCVGSKYYSSVIAPDCNWSGESNR